MAKAYDQSFKDTILLDIKQSHLSVYQAAKKYKVNANTIYSWQKGSQDSQVELRRANKKIKELEAEVEVLCSLVKKFSAESAKKKT